ncbi:MAG: hypothetical protein QXN17_08325 [Nitrososphaerota archaeon]
MLLRIATTCTTLGHEEGGEEVKLVCARNRANLTRFRRFSKNIITWLFNLLFNISQRISPQPLRAEY